MRGALKVFKTGHHFDHTDPVILGSLFHLTVPKEEFIVVGKKREQVTGAGSLESTLLPANMNQNLHWKSGKRYMLLKPAPSHVLPSVRLHVQNFL